MANEVIDAYLAKDAGAGFEEMGAQDFSAPFLIILQAGSPQLKEEHPLYVPDAKVGRILNTQSNKVYKECHIVPCKYTFRYVEWKDRTTGGGFVASYDRAHEPKNLTVDGMTGITRTRDGNVIQQTSYYLGMLKEENYERVILPMTSTQLKVARKWNSVMQSQRVVHSGTSVIKPMFAYHYKLTTVSQSNNKGTWYGWLVQIDEPVGDLAVYDMAKETNRIENFLPERLLANMSTGSDIDAALGSDEAM